MDISKNHSQSGCSICDQLSDSEFASQKYGWEERDTSLPAVSSNLVVVLDLQPGSQREKQLWQCPECGTYYFYQSDYEYLVNGTEDQQTLTRITIKDAQAMLDQEHPDQL